jgi:hypothetical protein
MNTDHTVEKSLRFAPFKVLEHETRLGHTAVEFSVVVNTDKNPRGYFYICTTPTQEMALVVAKALHLTYGDDAERCLNDYYSGNPSDESRMPIG